jgi:CIC family chloride channel protein
MNHSQIKSNITRIKLRKLIVAAIIIGFASSFLALSLKRITEYYESAFFTTAEHSNLFFILFPILGLSLIYVLRQYLFKKKQNKGITEIFDSTESKSKNLPVYKIPSHFFNGFLTVIFGGSTGIEVSTVVASATIGSVAQQKANFFREYKTELICAGVAAGITALFSSPVAGILFALEVISRKVTKVFLLVTILAAAMASGLVYLLHEKPLFEISIATWHYRAIPYFLLLGIFAGIHSVYLTRCVLFFKSRFSKIKVHYHKIIIGSILLSIALLLLPQLYGDGYHAMKEMLHGPTPAMTMSLIITFAGILILKPIVTSATLASGGDGGVFAPSLFMGAFLGYLLAIVLNTYFNAGVIPLNFMVIGMAAVLSASIHAPFTALFLVCGLTGDYALFFPIMAACLISKYTAKAMYPFTVYTFSTKAAN